MREISVQTDRKTQLVDITQDVASALGDANGASAALIFVPHTTAGVTINEHADPAVARDFEAALERMVGDSWGWQHVEAGEENARSHIRASLMSPTGRDGARSSSRNCASRSAPGRHRVRW